MKTIRVVAAVIRAVNNENKPVIFATQRGYGEFKGGWEFPGGFCTSLSAGFRISLTSLVFPS